MTRSDVKVLRAEITKALEDTLSNSKTGIKFDINIGNISFSEDGEVSFRTKLNAISSNKDSEGNTIVKKAGGEKNALILGLPDNWYGAVFTMMGKKYKLVDLNPRAPKYPFIVERIPDGKKFKAPSTCKNNIIAAIK